MVIVFCAYYCANHLLEHHIAALRMRAFYCTIRDLILFARDPLEVDPQLSCADKRANLV